MNNNFTAISIAGFVLGNSCNPSTKIISTGKDSDKEVLSEKLNKVLVQALFKSETSGILEKIKLYGPASQKVWTRMRWTK